MNQEVISLKDGVNITIFDDYIGKLIKSSRGYYEEEILLNFIDYLPTNGVIYDIGANIGNHTIFFSKYLKPKMIISFEPSSENFSLLEKNVKDNNLENVILYNVAVGLNNQKGTLKFNKTNTGASKIIENVAGNVDIVKIDDLEIELPNFIKIDVEGFEYNVLQGVEKCLEASSPTIWLEIHHENYTLVDNFLSKYDYVQVDRWLDNYIYIKAGSILELHTSLNFIKNKAFTRFNNKISELNLKYRKLSESLNKCNKETESLNENNNTLLNKNRDLQNEISMKNSELKSLKEFIVTNKFEKQNLQEQNDSLLNTIMAMNKKVEKLLTEHFNEKLNFIKANEKLKIELNSLKSKLEKIEEILSKTIEEKQILSNKIIEQDEEITILNDRIRSLINNETLIEEMRKEKQKLIEKHHYEICKKDETINRLSGQKTELTKENELKTKIENELIHENQKLLNQINDSSELINKLRGELTNKNQLVTKLTKENKELIIQNIDLKSELENEIKDKILLINKEELFTLKYEEVSSVIKKYENENMKINQKLNKLESDKVILNRKYNALKDSKLGSITLKYWSLRKKLKRG